MKERIHIEVDNRGSFLLISVTGELSERTAVHFKKTSFSEIKEHGCSHMVIDFSKTDYIDSSGIGLLSALAVKLGELGGKLGVLSPSEAVRDVLAISFDRSNIREYKSLDEAAEDLDNV
ncbi:MAG: hypothetical protein A2268_00855 [Candidatus Raymondbacteria bacterium RifOxyA12_full_50_37]|uniref:Anti-sigma factor antagonist n=1 Tax=Candidatus Raymondbacteria bacterium RIFOXYD12_FULL_49_13 TaxID=1817890 RepID=A0A1F7F1V2_UNCRA|nr:MAG: hypothetical protein A2268_00855 [Candidatus Raymondbacteria bacterium RifOxyA12_full_50_37]OGJ90077.1 MAG: hypothetical protein A2248_19180 [Candidatus Raymondbacteria bacterium RIFOXYA2_FULL_49_16]OGJ96719.1 MAG: hypothetical protein A2350_02040 [Candidatus Raymondbacteria bacterium RifOxyB12_full_50_8]OGJ96762.1 MAG: hypothetical protein A2453_06310 [Candidatus Raymondbacteria bacterium RIFOXYC2_FULL_50_21]OGJ99019.1 MAG: hypothetical protein A2487_02105 [Candidatus Raymondbacteria b